jgi:Flp pilus assembly protein TadB
LPSPTPRVLGAVPLEVPDALLDEFRRVADRHQRGFMVEHVMERATS